MPASLAIGIAARTGRQPGPAVPPPVMCCRIRPPTICRPMKSLRSSGRPGLSRSTRPVRHGPVYIRARGRSGSAARFGSWSMPGSDGSCAWYRSEPCARLRRRVPPPPAPYGRPPAAIRLGSGRLCARWLARPVCRPTSRTPNRMVRSPGSAPPCRRRPAARRAPQRGADHNTVRSCRRCRGRGPKLLPPKPISAAYRRDATSADSGRGCDDAQFTARSRPPVRPQRSALPPPSRVYEEHE